jgi:hypothetical protein
MYCYLVSSVYSDESDSVFTIPLMLPARCGSRGGARASVLGTDAKERRPHDKGHTPA